MIPIKEVMTKEVITVQENTPIYECLTLLTQHSISGLPVLDAANRVVGILSEKDVLGLLIDDNLNVSSKAADYMTREPIMFGPEEDVVKICRFFANSHIRRVPIVLNKKLCGIVSRRDIVRLILEAKSKMSNLRYV